MLRTNSQMMKQRAMLRYQKCLALVCIFLALTSMALILTAVILLKFYFMDHLYFWSFYFKICPVSMLFMGFYGFFIGVCGVIFAGYSNTRLLYVLILLMSIRFVVQLFSISMAMEVHKVIEKGKFGEGKVWNILQLYDNDSDITATFDTLQRNMRCCGGVEWEKGYLNYLNTPFGERRRGVPDSCCHNYKTGCGRNKLIRSRRVKGIFVDGCLTVLQTVLAKEVVPVLGVYIGVGVVLAITDVVITFLSMVVIRHIVRCGWQNSLVWSNFPTTKRSKKKLNQEAADNVNENNVKSNE